MLAQRYPKKRNRKRTSIGSSGTITPYTEFEGQVYVLTKEEGGRQNPFFSGYRPQFYFRTTDVTGVIQLRKALKCVSRRPHYHVH